MTRGVGAGRDSRAASSRQPEVRIGAAQQEMFMLVTRDSLEKGA